MKNYKKILKNQRGSITSLVLVTILFFITILSTAYAINASLRKSQLKSQISIKEEYEKDIENVNEIYESVATKIVDGVKIPIGFYYVGGTVDSGLVISDNSADENKYKGQTSVGTDLQGNQYVWIEVPRTDTVYSTAGTTITDFTDTEYTTIEEDLHTYTSTYRDGTSYRDIYYSDDTTGLTSTEYENLKKKMLKSIYKNEGFYIGRYETGIVNSYRTDSGEPIEEPVVQVNVYPYTYVTCSQAQTLASNMNSGNYTSSLLFGVQWDLVLKYLETKGATQEELKGTTTGSVNWGNYANAEFIITNTNAKYAIGNKNSWTLGDWSPISSNYTKSSSETENWVLLSTGANEIRNSKKNIYDLAGNVWELTLEYTNNSLIPCVCRGGSYGDDGSVNPVSYRNDDYTSDSINSLGFRISLY